MRPCSCAVLPLKVKMKVAQSCLLFETLWTIYSSWNSPGQNTEVGSFSHLQGIFPTQGLNPGLLHCRQILYQLSLLGLPLRWYFICTTSSLFHHSLRLALRGKVVVVRPIGPVIIGSLPNLLHCEVGPLVGCCYG